MQDAATILGLDPLMQRKPAELSGGQRQRVAIGRAMVREPQAFLMDEPLSNLDAKLRVQMRAELSRLHERLGTTTVYVTHDQVEAMTLGPPRRRAARTASCSRWTPRRTSTSIPPTCSWPAFIGSPPMNLVEATVARRPRVVRRVRHRPIQPAALAAFDGPHGDPRDPPLRHARTWPCGTATTCPTIDVTAEVTEELGSEVNVIFPWTRRPSRPRTITAATDEEDADRSR